MNNRILVVDDEMPIRRLLEKIFCREYEVFCAADAAEALEIVKTQPISLIISDQKMPGMSGLQMFEDIIVTHPQIIRILLSGYIEKSDLQSALENKLIHKFIAKPWNIKDLKTMVAETLAAHSKIESKVC
jgi:two-component system, NtrC family, response regulator HupR/HoxA